MCAGLEFVKAMWGCLFARIVAVPVCPPDPTRLQHTLPHFCSIVDGCGAVAILTDRTFHMVRFEFSHLFLFTFCWIASAAVRQLNYWCGAALQFPSIPLISYAYSPLYSSPSCGFGSQHNACVSLVMGC